RLTQISSCYFGHNIVFEFVCVSAFRTHRLSFVIEFQLMPELTHPTHMPRGVAHHQRIVGHVFGDDGSRADKSILPDIMTAYNRRICSNRCSLPYNGTRVLAFSVDGAPRINDIGEYH